jgi:uncharacterized Rossmann fold enzyme
MDQPSLEHLVGIQDDVRMHFGWTLESDLKSAKMMAEMFGGDQPFGVSQWAPEMREDVLQYLQSKIQSCQKLVFIGAAVEPEDLIDLQEEGTEFIVADGAIGACFETISPLCVISDFDGQPYLDKATSLNIPFVLHAHGDNTERWLQTFERWSSLNNLPQIVLTHQTPQFFHGLHNVGGFTDGDRAVCFAFWCGVRHQNIKFIGYDKHLVGRWSGHTTPEQKLEKLKWMDSILNLFLCYQNKDEPSNVISIKQD